jgi:hypothetical protein
MRVGIELLGDPLQQGGALRRIGQPPRAIGGVRTGNLCLNLIAGQLGEALARRAGGGVDAGEHARRLL